MERAIARNRKLWGVHGQKTVRALTGLCICSECQNRLKYIGGRSVPSLKCSGDKCSQLYKGVREELVVRWVTGELPKVAAGRLAAMVEQSEPVEVALLRQRIDELEALRDQELQPVIAAKRQRLEQLLVTPNVDADLMERISDPAWLEALTYEELTVLLHRLLACILITKQVPTGLSLQL